MNWSTTAQVAVLMIAYVGGIAAICHYILVAAASLDTLA